VVLLKHKEAVAGIVICNRRFWLIVALDALMPELCSRDMQNTPPRMFDANAPLDLLPIVEEALIERA
jgi:hypothetical protein